MHPEFHRVPHRERPYLIWRANIPRWNESPNPFETGWKHHHVWMHAETQSQEWSERKVLQDGPWLPSLELRLLFHPDLVADRTRQAARHETEMTCAAGRLQSASRY